MLVILMTMTMIMAMMMTMTTTTMAMVIVILILMRRRRRMKGRREMSLRMMTTMKVVTEHNHGVDCEEGGDSGLRHYGSYVDDEGGRM